MIGGVFTGRPFRADQVLYRDARGGARLHVWFGSDDRIHNHPWEWIECKVIRGSYYSEEYRREPGKAYYDYERLPRRSLPQDPSYRIGHDVFHRVISVAPRTVSVMVFGPQVNDGKQWGHLVNVKPTFQDSAVYFADYECSSENPEFPAFLDAMRYLNPHMRPPGWACPAYAHGEPERTLTEWLREAGFQS